MYCNSRGNTLVFYKGKEAVSTTYIYACLLRPPMPGAIPRDGLDFVDFRGGETRDSGHHHWGVAAYKRPLTEEEISHYDLEFIEILG